VRKPRELDHDAHLYRAYLRAAERLLDRAACIRGSGGRPEDAGLFEALEATRCATRYTCGHNKAQVYHVHRPALYRAIGEPDSRFRNPPRWRKRSNG
jgi:hypothetical protein